MAIRLPRRQIVLLWVTVVVVLSFLIRLVKVESDYSIFIQSFVFLMVVLFFVKFTSLPSIVASLRTHYKVFLGSMITLVLMGHLVGASWYSFPFPSWEMFCCAPNTNTIRFNEYKGTLRSGGTVLLTPARLFPSLSYGRFSAKLRRYSDYAMSSKELPDRKAWLHQYSETLIVVGQLYNQKHPEDPIRTIEVYRNRFDINNYLDDSSITRQFVWRVEVD